MIADWLGNMLLIGLKTIAHFLIKWALILLIPCVIILFLLFRPSRKKKNQVSK